MADTQVYCNETARSIYLHDNIKHDSIAKVNAFLLQLIGADDEQETKKKNYTREPIKLYINSYGGYIDDMWSLIDIMLNSKTPIDTYCTGYAMSAGFKIFLAGHKRFITKHAKLMYHQLSGGCRGTYTEIKESMPDLERDQKQIENYVMERTNIMQEKLDEVREKKLDWYIYPDDVIKLGIATEVI